MEKLKKTAKTTKPIIKNEVNGSPISNLSTEQITIWKNKKLLPKKLADNYLDMIERSKTEQEQSQADTQTLAEFHNFILNNWGILVSGLNTLNAHNKGLFKNVDLDSSFGVSRKITDLMYYLQELLEKAELKNIRDNEYEVVGRVNNSIEEDIVLKYEFSASNIDEATTIFTNYKTTMIGRGLKIWLAYWRMGNELHRVEYTMPMIDVMKKLTDSTRKTNYSVPEKQQHWNVTKMLQRTTLSIEKHYKQRGTGKQMTRWLERPLIEILGGEKDIAAMDKYPEKIAVKILKTEKSTKGFVPAVFKNETLLADHNDAYLSFILQVKSAHDRGEKDIKMEWEYLFLYGGLEETAINRKGEAKAKMRAKLDRLKVSKIINEWFEIANGVIIACNKDLYGHYE